MNALGESVQLLLGPGEESHCLNTIQTNHYEFIAYIILKINMAMAIAMNFIQLIRGNPP